MELVNKPNGLLKEIPVHRGQMASTNALHKQKTSASTTAPLFVISVKK
jgi:hypothetical protein